MQQEPIGKTVRKNLNRPPGRPPKDPSRRRTVRIKVNFTPAEQEAVLLRAASTGLTPAVYIRRTALRKPLPRSIPSINREAFRVLAGIGSNLNQLLHHLNSNASFSYPASLPDLHALLGLLQSVKRLLLGR